MDDPTKDTIPRSAVEYCLRKETVSTNPEKYKTHEKFIDYMNDPDISEFGHWMHSNGFNCALTAISVDLEKIPSVTPSAQPGWIPCSRELPKNKSYVLTIIYIPGRQAHIRSGWYEDGLFMNDNGDTWKPTDKEVVGWMYQPKLPKPYREGGQDEN